MSLDWYVDEVEDYKELCWIDNGETDVDGEKVYDLNPVTEVLIWATVSAGLPKITKDNFEEFFERLNMFENGVTTLMYKRSQTEEEKLNYGRQPRPRKITLAEIRQHIGLSTNASRLTQAQFHNQLIEQMRRRAKTALQENKFAEKIMEEGRD